MTLDGLNGRTTDFSRLNGILRQQTEGISDSTKLTKEALLHMNDDKSTMIIPQPQLSTPEKKVKLSDASVSNLPTADITREFRKGYSDSYSSMYNINTGKNNYDVFKEIKNKDGSRTIIYKLETEDGIRYSKVDIKNNDEDTVIGIYPNIAKNLSELEQLNKAPNEYIILENHTGQCTGRISSNHNGETVLELIPENEYTRHY